jgi:histidinol-phosphatase (PHP family)
VGFVNYHTHSRHCDGVKAPEEYIKEAIARGFDSLGFSAHAPLPFENTWSIRPGMLDQYCVDIRHQQKKYSRDLNVLLGLEIDYIPGISKPFAEWRKECGLDYIIGGVHLVKRPGNKELWFIDGGPQGYDTGLKDLFDMNIQVAVETYFGQLWEMLRIETLDIVAHCDKIKMNNRERYFSTNDKWYKELLVATAEVIAHAGCIAEVNTRGIYKKRCEETYPSEYLLKEFLKLKVPVTISTDAHHPTEISLQIPETVELLRKIGFKETMVFHQGAWQARPL